MIDTYSTLYINIYYIMCTQIYVSTCNTHIDLCFISHTHIYIYILIICISIGLENSTEIETHCILQLPPTEGLRMVDPIQNQGF